MVEFREDGHGSVAVVEAFEEVFEFTEGEHLNYNDICKTLKNRLNL